MTMTDPIADMLTRLRNANQAYHDSVSMPYSKLKQGVAEILKQEGYITSFEVQDLDGGAPYPVITGDYAAEQARWTSIPIEPGRPLAKPTPLFTKLDPGLGQSGPSWAPIEAS